MLLPKNREKTKTHGCCQPTPSPVIAKGSASLFDQPREKSLFPGSDGSDRFQWVSFHSQLPRAFLWVDQPRMVPFCQALFIFRTEGRNGTDSQSPPQICSMRFFRVISPGQRGCQAQGTALLRRCRKALDTSQCWRADERRKRFCTGAEERSWQGWREGLQGHTCGNEWT